MSYEALTNAADIRVGTYLHVTEDGLSSFPILIDLGVTFSVHFSPDLNPRLFAQVVGITGDGFAVAFSDGRKWEMSLWNPDRDLTRTVFSSQQVRSADYVIRREIED